jgi:hypothetical protein
MRGASGARRLFARRDATADVGIFARLNPHNTDQQSWTKKRRATLGIKARPAAEPDSWVYRRETTTVRGDGGAIEWETGGVRQQRVVAGRAWIYAS